MVVYPDLSFTILDDDQVSAGLEQSTFDCIEKSKTYIISHLKRAISSINEKILPFL